MCSFAKKLSVVPLPPKSFLILKTPEELQRKFIGQEHGGAHREASNGVD